MPRKPRFSEYWAAVGTGNPYRNLPQDSIIDAPSVVNNYQYLLSALRSKAPGQWSQNLLELSRHFTGPAYLAINTLANQAASAIVQVFEETYDPEEGDLEIPHTEPVCKLLANPNEEESFGELNYQITQQLGLTGIALIWKPAWNNFNIPTELYVIPSSSALPWPPSPIYPHGSYLVQPYFPYGPFSSIPSYQSAAGARIPAEQIIRIKNAHPILRYDGYAVLTALQRQMDTVESIDLARFNTQQKGADPTISLDFDPNVFNPSDSDFQRLRVQLEALYSGPQNAGRIMFNPFGTTVSKLSNAPQEMAWESGWEQLVKFLLAAYGTPAPITGMTDATSYAALYASLRQFHLISLNPLLKKESDKFTRDLVRPYFGEDLYLKLSAEKITDEDVEIKKYQGAIPAKVIRRNEYRKFLDLPPLRGPEGDELIGGKSEEVSKVPQTENPDNEQEPSLEQSRPQNLEGAGSIGPRPKSFRFQRQEALASVLDRAKHNGIAHPLSSQDKDVLQNGFH